MTENVDPQEGLSDPFIFYIDDDESLSELIDNLFPDEAQNEDDEYSNDAQEYTSGNGSDILKQLFMHVKMGFSVIYEEYHVDREYRDSYYLFFASQHSEINRFCVRISLFIGKVDFNMFAEPLSHAVLQDKYIGCIVLRPLSFREIGKTLIDPNKYYFRDERIFARLTSFTTTILGVKLTVNAFPYSMQDSETTKCVDITLLNLIDYFSNHYADYHRALPSALAEIKENQGYERVLPAQGMSYFCLTKILAEYGFYPRYYNQSVEKQGNSLTLQKILYYYIASGIPVAVGLSRKDKPSTEGHSIICIGYSEPEHDKVVKELIKPTATNHYPITDISASYSRFIVMDDGQIPYADQLFPNLAKDDSLYVTDVAVPLYRRMFMDVTDAIDIFDEVTSPLRKDYKPKPQIMYRAVIFLSNKEYKNYIKRYHHGKNFNPSPTLEAHMIKHQPVIRKVFLTSGRSYKDFKMCSLPASDSKYKKILAHVPFPHFIWVCELYLKSDYFVDNTKKQLVFGELVLDATFKLIKGRSGLIYLRYFNDVAFRFPEEPDDIISELLNQGKTRLSGISEKHPAFNKNLSVINYDIRNNE